MRLSTFALLCLASCLGAPSAAAQARKAVHDLAAAIVAGSQPRWTGPRTPYPPEQPRPAGAQTLASRRLPLRLHSATPLPAARWRAAMTALENAAMLWQRDGFVAPPPDGARGGDAAFDLYVVGSAEHTATAQADAPALLGYDDASLVFASVTHAALAQHPAACIADAYAQAALLALEPAESEGIRRATAAWFAWRLSGRWGCDDAAAQERAGLTPVLGSAGDGAGGALWLRQLDGAITHGSGEVVRDLWQLARQRTWDGDALRANPSWWDALHAVLKSRHEDHDVMVQRYAVAWRRPPGGGEPYATYQASSLPRRTPSIELPTWGSASVDVHWPAAAAGEVRQLRVWLRGEYDARWSVAALRRAADGRVLGELGAAPQRHTQQYLPVVCTPETASITLVVTHLQPLPGPLQTPRTHAFYLLLDR